MYKEKLNKITEVESDDFKRKYSYEFKINGELTDLGDDLKIAAYEMILENFEEELRTKIYNK